MPTLPELETLTDDQGVTYQLVDAEARSQLENKQDTLIEGDMITIDGNEISYTGPTINDSIKSTTSLWSSSKIDSELSGKANASSTYTKAEVDTLVAACTHRLVVAQLPTTDIDPNTIYYVPISGATGNNIYQEYMYINGAWELLGSTEIDLSNYYTKTQVDALLAGKVDSLTLDSYYTKTQVDALISPLATKEELMSAQLDNINVSLGTNQNLIKYPYDGYEIGDSVTNQGVTFTVNSDKTITVTGTDSNPGSAVAPQLRIALSSSLSYPLPKVVAGHKYRLSGSPVQTATNPVKLSFRCGTMVVETYGTPMEFTIPAGATVLDWSVYLIADSVVNADVTFTPELVDLDGGSVELADVAFTGDYDDLINKLSAGDGIDITNHVISADVDEVTIGIDPTTKKLVCLIGGGSSVSFTQVVSTGTKIGTITIDGVATDVYAPTPNTYTAGDGLDLTNGVFSADVDGTTIGINSSTKKLECLVSGGGSKTLLHSKSVTTNTYWANILKEFLPYLENLTEVELLDAVLEVVTGSTSSSVVNVFRLYQYFRDSTNNISQYIFNIIRPNSNGQDTYMIGISKSSGNAQGTYMQYSFTKSSNTVTFGTTNLGETQVANATVRLYA